MECIQLSLFGKTCPELSVPTEEKISEPCWKNLPAWNNQTFQFLDLRVGGADGAKLEQSQETDGAWLGDSLTLNIGEFPNAERESLLSQKDASKETGVSVSQISCCAKGQKKSCKGYEFQRIEEFPMAVTKRRFGEK